MVVLTGAKRGARHVQRLRALEHPDRGPHRRLELEDRRGVGIRRVDRLAVDDDRQPEHAVALVERRAQRVEVDPQVVRVDVAVAADVLQRLEVLLGRLGGLAQHEPPSPRRRATWPPLRSASVRSVTSITNGSSSRATQARMRGSSTAPRLSEFDTNA